MPRQGNWATVDARALIAYFRRSHANMKPINAGAFGTTDRMNRFVPSRHTAIRREGWYYLLITAVVLGGAVFKEVNLLLLLAGMLLGSALLNWQAVSANLRGLRVDRKLPLMLSAGDQLSVRLRLSNTRRRLGAWAVVVEQEISRVTSVTAGADREGPLSVHVLFPYVSAGRSCNGGYRGRLPARGRYLLGPSRLSTRFPFGLFSRATTVGQTESLIVLPRLGRLSAGWATRRLEAFAGADRQRARPGNDGDFYGLREWHNGDAQRLIHWRTSARLGKPVVRQFERPRNNDVAVVLDLWQPPTPSPEHVENVELAVSLAATLVTDLCRKGGGSVYLALNNDRPECSGGASSSALLQSLMERLAVVEAQAGDALPALLDEAVRHIPAGTDIVVASTRPVDFNDTKRFAAVWSDPLLRERMRHIHSIDTSNENLSELFRAE